MRRLGELEGEKERAPRLNSGRRREPEHPVWIADAVLRLSRAALRLVNQHDGYAIADGINAAAGLAFQTVFAGHKEDLFVANRADERIEQILRDHGEHVSAAEAQKDSH
jgi:hypothetical protein